MRNLTVARAVAWRTLHNVFTNKALVIPQLAFPLFFFAAFAGGLSRIHNVPGFNFPENYTSFQFVFVLLQSAAFGGVFTGFGIARDFEGGFAKRLMLAAPHRTGIVLGYAAAALVRWLVTAAFLTVVGFAVGIKVGGNGVDLPALYLLAAIVNTAALFWACGVAMRLRTMQAGPVDADAGVPGALLRTGLRPAQPAERLDPRRRGRQPAHANPRGRPQLHRRVSPPRSQPPSAPRSRCRALLAVGDARPAQGRSRRLESERKPATRRTASAGAPRTCLVAAAVPDRHRSFGASLRAVDRRASRPLARLVD